MESKLIKCFLILGALVLLAFTLFYSPQEEYPLREVNGYLSTKGAIYTLTEKRQAQGADKFIWTFYDDGVDGTLNRCILDVGGHPESRVHYGPGTRPITDDLIKMFEEIKKEYPSE